MDASGHQAGGNRAATRLSGVTSSRGMTWPSTLTPPRCPGPISRASVPASLTSRPGNEAQPDQAQPIEPSWIRPSRATHSSIRLSVTPGRRDAGLAGPTAGPAQIERAGPRTAGSRKAAQDQEPRGRARAPGAAREPNQEPSQRPAQDPGREPADRVPTGPASSVTPPPRSRGHQRRTMTKMTGSTLFRRPRRRYRTSIQWPRAPGPPSSAGPLTCWRLPSPAGLCPAGRRSPPWPRSWVVLRLSCFAWATDPHATATTATTTARCCRRAIARCCPRATEWCGRRASQQVRARVAAPMRPASAPSSASLISARSR